MKNNMKGVSFNNILLIFTPESIPTTFKTLFSRTEHFQAHVYHHDLAIIILENNCCRF